jgi:hypothetical protein
MKEHVYKSFYDSNTIAILKEMTKDMDREQKLKERSKTVVDLCEKWKKNNNYISTAKTATCIASSKRSRNSTTEKKMKNAIDIESTTDNKDNINTSSASSSSSSSSVIDLTSSSMISSTTPTKGLQSLITLFGTQYNENTLKGALISCSSTFQVAVLNILENNLHELQEYEKRGYNEPYWECFQHHGDGTSCGMLNKMSTLRCTECKTFRSIL